MSFENWNTLGNFLGILILVVFIFYTTSTRPLNRLHPIYIKTHSQNLMFHTKLQLKFLFSYKVTICYLHYYTLVVPTQVFVATTLIWGSTFFFVIKNIWGFYLIFIESDHFLSKVISSAISFLTPNFRRSTVFFCYLYYTL